MQPKPDTVEQAKQVQRGFWFHFAPLESVTGLVFDRGCIQAAALSPQHYRVQLERSAGPMIKLIRTLTARAPDQLQAFRQQFDSIVARYFQENAVRQDYLLSCAVKS